MLLFYTRPEAGSLLLAASFAAGLGRRAGEGPGVFSRAGALVASSGASAQLVVVMDVSMEQFSRARAVLVLMSSSCVDWHFFVCQSSSCVDEHVLPEQFFVCQSSSCAHEQFFR